MTQLDAPDIGRSNAAGESQRLHRVPPQSIQAEACVLGSMILDAAAVDIVVQINKSSHFYRPAHQMVFDMIIEMRQDTKRIDTVLLRDELVRKNQLEQIGGVEYLLALVEGVPSAANAEYYARVVRDKALLRELIVAGTEIASEAYETHEEANKVIDQAEQRIFEIAQEQIGDEAVTLKGLLQETFETLQENEGQMITGLDRKSVV